MAKDQDRRLNGKEDRSASRAEGPLPLGEERLPAWARSMEEAAEEEKAPARFSAPENEEKKEPEAPLDAPDEENEAIERKAPVFPDGEEEDAEPGDAPEPIRRSSRREAEEAWDREAQKTEGGSGKKGGAAGKDKKNQRGKKGKKDAGGKKKGRKKNVSKADDRRSFLRTMAIVFICAAVFLMTAAMVASSFISSPWLALPRRIVTAVVTPVQEAFSKLTGGIADYVRTLKVRGNIEYEYNQLLIQLDEMASDTALMEELRHQNQQLRAMVLEQDDPNHEQLNPIGARVIGKVGNNYFSTLTLDVGKEQGVDDYMAVVSNGGLVGVTYNTREHQCSVRCIIDSDCTVAGFVQSSRDQGSVKGTLGSTGEAICRMYYLPDNSLPRPGDVVVTSNVGMEFPAGIPIGYIRESTRGMEDNKSYVVVEPKVDFQHLEFVTVYRYHPSYSEKAQNRVSASQVITLEALTTERPTPEFQLSGLSDFMYTATATPNPDGGATAAPGATETPKPQKTATPEPGGATRAPNLEYVSVDLSGASPSPSPRPTFTPTPSPAPTPDPGALTVEDDE